MNINAIQGVGKYFAITGCYRPRGDYDGTYEFFVVKTYKQTPASRDEWVAVAKHHALSIIEVGEDKGRTVDDYK